MTLLDIDSHVDILLGLFYREDGRDTLLRIDDWPSINYTALFLISVCENHKHYMADFLYLPQINEKAVGVSMQSRTHGGRGWGQHFANFPAPWDSVMRCADGLGELFCLRSQPGQWGGVRLCISGWVHTHIHAANLKISRKMREVKHFRFINIYVSPTELYPACLCIISDSAAGWPYEQQREVQSTSWSPFRDMLHRNKPRLCKA
jgi:hypothetical protein